MMTKSEMIRIVQSQLAIDLNCTVDELNGGKDEVIFKTVADNVGRRPFPRGEHHFEMLTMGGSLIISAAEEILEIVKVKLMNKNRDEAFSMPFLCGYLPDIDRLSPLVAPEDFVFEFVEQANISSLYDINGFDHAIGSKVNELRPDVLAIVAKMGEQIVGMAGASADGVQMWQIGIDVLPEFRNRGLAAYLVNSMTIEILRRGKVPYYCCLPSNVSSQRVAYRSGYYPVWVSTYKGSFV